MKDWKEKLRMRLPALVLLASTLLFWEFYERYELSGPVLLSSPSFADATRLRGDCHETDGRLILSVPAGGKPARVNFRLPNGTEYDQIRVRGRIKVDGVVVGRNPWRCARLLLVQYDADNKWISGHHGVVATDGTHDWEAYEDVFEIDQKAAFVDLVIQQIGLEGTAEFDGLLAEPIRVRASYGWWRALFAAMWMGMGVIYFRRCRLDGRRLRILILLNAIAIIAGTLMPGRWIEDTTDYAKEEAVKILETAPPRSPKHAESQKPPPQREVTLEKMDRFGGMVGGVHGVGHFGLFASLCFLVYLSAALERQHRSYYYRVAFDILLFSAVTESLQYLTIDRTPDIRDWLIDLGGMVAAFLVFQLVRAIMRFRSGKIAA